MPALAKQICPAAILLSRRAQVVGLLNTYLPLTVIVFVINVKWFTVMT